MVSAICRDSAASSQLFGVEVESADVATAAGLTSQAHGMELRRRIVDVDVVADDDDLLGVASPVASVSALVGSGAESELVGDSSLA